MVFSNQDGISLTSWPPSCLCLLFNVFFFYLLPTELHIESSKQSVCHICQITIYTNTMQNLDLRRDPSLLSQVGM